MRNPSFTRFAPPTSLLGWLPGAAATLVALAIILASCGSSGEPAATAVRSSTPIAAPTVPPVGTESPTAPGTASTVPLTPANPAPATLAPTTGSAFTLLRMATAADPALAAPDARTFVASFAPKAPQLYVVFALRTGLTGAVVCTITANGVQTAGPITLTHRPKNSWGDFRITSRGTFVVGSYRATLTYGPTGEAATIDFTVQ